MSSNPNSRSPKNQASSQSQSLPFGSDETCRETSPEFQSILEQISNSLDELKELPGVIADLKATVQGAQKEWLTVREVADLTGRSDFTVRRWIKEEKIDAIRIEGSGSKGQLLIPRSELRKLIPIGKGSQIPSVHCP